MRTVVELCICHWAIDVPTYRRTSDVVLETKVLVSRRLEDKNESLGLGLGLEHLVLVLFSVLNKKSGSFSRLLL